MSRTVTFGIVGSYGATGTIVASELWKSCDGEILAGGRAPVSTGEYSLPVGKLFEERAINNYIGPSIIAAYGNRCLRSSHYKAAYDLSCTLPPSAPCLAVYGHRQPSRRDSARVTAHSETIHSAVQRANRHLGTGAQGVGPRESSYYRVTRGRNSCRMPPSCGSQSKSRLRVHDVLAKEGSVISRRGCS